MKTIRNILLLTAVVFFLYGPRTAKPIKIVQADTPIEQTVVESEEIKEIKNLISNGELTDDQIEAIKAILIEEDEDTPINEIIQLKQIFEEKTEKTNEGIEDLIKKFLN